MLLASTAALADPMGYAINSRGNFQDDSQVFALWQINLATGQETYVGWTGAGIIYTDVEGLAFDSQGVLFGADDDTNTLLRISTQTGSATPIGGSNGNMGLPGSQIMDFGMTFDCEGSLWLSSDVRKEFYQADPDTGQLTLVGSAGSLGAPITGLAAWGDEVYGIGQGSHRPDSNGPDLVDSPYLYRIDTDSGTAETIGYLGDSVGLYHNAGLAFDGDGKLWAIVDRRDINGQDLSSRILRIDPDTGSAQVVAETIVGIESLAITPPGGCDGDPGGNGEPVEGAPHVVPVFGPGGLLVLLVLLLSVALVRLRSA